MALAKQNNVTKAQKKAPLAKEFVTPFLTATKNVITTMAQVPVAAQAPRKTTSNKPSAEISSVMPMRSPGLMGQLVVSFNAPVLLDITSKMIMEECTEVDDMVLDTVGELTNIITGAAKAILEQGGYDFDMARPVTYQASQYETLKLVGSPRIVVPYAIDSGEFFIELGFVNI